MTIALFIFGFALGHVAISALLWLRDRRLRLRGPIMLPVRRDLGGRPFFSRPPDRETRLEDGTVIYDWSETRDVQ